MPRPPSWARKRGLRGKRFPAEPGTCATLAILYGRVTSERDPKGGAFEARRPCNATRADHVGNLDPLRDESILMAARWQLDGSKADLDVWPEGPHAFANIATPLGELAALRATGWSTAALDAALAGRKPAIAKGPPGLEPGTSGL
jgi:hypothetical protein